MMRKFKLGEWLVQPELNELSAANKTVRVEPKVMEVLRCLVARAGEVVSKEALLQTVWHDRFVTEEVLTTTMSELRKALGDDAKQPRFIQTIPRNGYRLIAVPEEVPSEPPAVPAWRRQWKLLAAAVVVLLAAAIWQIGNRSQPPHHIRSLAVLPLKNLSGDPQQEALAEAMTDALITDLARVTPLRVVSRTSVMQYKTVSKTTPQIARELNVDAIVEGSVQRAGERVRVTIQLIDAHSDQHLRAESYERAAHDALTWQSELSNVIAQELRASLTLHEQARQTTAAPAAAHEAYLQGRQWWNKRTEAGLRQALPHFERALQLAPTSALPYSGLADTYLQFVNLDAMRPEEAFPQAKAAALKAVQLDDRSAEAHTSLAMLRLCYEWDRAGAEAEFKRALALNPNYATARNWYSQFLWTGGQLDEALAQIKQAQQLEPDSLAVQLTAGTIHSLREEHDEAIACFRRVLDLDPKYETAWKSLAKAYDRKALPQEADAAYQQFRALTEAPSVAQTKQRFASWSRRDDPNYLLNKLGLLWKRKYVRASYIARLYADIGNKERALAWLEKAFAERDSDLLLLDTDHSWDRLRREPRFVALVQRIGANS